LAHEIYLYPAELDKAHILNIKSPSGLLDEAYNENVLDTVIEYIKKLENNHED